VTVLDDLSTGYQDAVPPGAAFVRGAIRDRAASVLAECSIEAVLHFAASSLVGESVANPAKYWANNLGGTLALLDAMRLAGTGRIIFSSTDAVYGEPERTPIEETSPTGRPTRTAPRSRWHLHPGLHPRDGPRRPGDPAILLASARRIQADLGWQAHRDLRAMVTDAWQAMQARSTQVEE
jgi:UDP-glucose 4-epimerase